MSAAHGSAGSVRRSFARRTVLRAGALALIGIATMAPAGVFAQSASLSPSLSNAAFLIGKWQGGGWIEMAPGNRSEFRLNETVSVKLGGGALVIEGLGTRKGADGTDIVTHEALGILTYDARQNKPLLRAYRTGGQFVDADVKLEPNRLTWQFQVQGFGMTRYTTALDDKGRWFESGEMSKDGLEWRKFFETTLTRIAP